MDEITEQMEVRRQKLLKLKESGQALYPNDFKPAHVTSDLIAGYGSFSDEQLHAVENEFSLAGRIMGARSFGKASFFHLQDRAARLQIYVRRDRVGDDGYALFQQLDAGDIVGVWGRVVRTKTKELTI